MLREFIDFVDSILPSVSPKYKDEAKAAIKQFEKDGHQINYLTSSPLPELSQGDIISQVPFSYFDKNGEQKVFASDALVISTSCHIDQKKLIVMVPVLSIENSYEGNLVELKRNTIYNFMYIPDNELSDKYIWFDVATSFSKDLILENIKKGRLRRVSSLNQIGYYFFLAKLTVYLMRKEDEDTLYERSGVE